MAWAKMIQVIDWFDEDIETCVLFHCFVFFSVFFHFFEVKRVHCRLFSRNRFSNVCGLPSAWVRIYQTNALPSILLFFIGLFFDKEKGLLSSLSPSILSNLEEFFFQIFS